MPAQRAGLTQALGLQKENMATCHKCGRDAGYLFSICKRCKQADGQPSAASLRPGQRHIVTHYDKLHVAWVAPDTVVRAAYKVLSQAHHPDKNDGSVESQRLMQDINASYAVLSDPVRRAEHDRWIRSNQ